MEEIKEFDIDYLYSLFINSLKGMASNVPDDHEVSIKPIFIVSCGALIKFQLDMQELMNPNEYSEVMNKLIGQVLKQMEKLTLPNPSEEN